MLPDWAISLIPYRRETFHSDDWETDYEAGFWDYMKESDEVARYGIVAGYCRYFSPGGPILDIGSGEGILKDHLLPETYTQYLGVDLSENAINRADATRQDGKAAFVQANMEEYVPDRSFDVIIFNECLYYSETPLELVKRFESHLNPGGRFILSMTDLLKTRKIWQMLDQVYTLLETARCINSVGFSWTIRVYQLPR